MELEQLIRAARGLDPAELVLRGGRIVNVYSGEIETADLAISGGVVVGLGSYEGEAEVDVSGRYLAPGFIDPHLHVESTTVVPAEMARAVVPRGTTTLVADPHEIGNVLGIRGIRYMLEISRGLPLDFFFMAPSCVPATDMETAGAKLSAEDLKPLLDEPRVLGLAEVMNYPGVIEGQASVLDKIRLFSSKNIDGHAPELAGRDLSAYILPGISTEHECTRLEEAREKLARGMRVFIREGSQAKNLEALLPLVTDFNFRRIAFCTDDRHPEDLLEEGHLDHILRRAVALGLDPVKAVAMATVNGAEAFGLKRRGALIPGARADVVVMKSLEMFEVERVYKDGRLAAQDGELTAEVHSEPVPDWAGPMNTAALTIQNLELPVLGPRVRVIELLENSLTTGHLIEETPQANGLLIADPDRDLARLLVIDRHRGSGRPGQGLVKGFGLKKGALASSVAHDSHNLVVIGIGLEDILAAAQAVVKMRGGMAAAAGGRVIEEIPLPLAGLMSAATLPQAAAAGERLKKAAWSLGARPASPFMALSFLSLPVIPSLKLTDRGLVDVNRFEFTELFTT